MDGLFRWMNAARQKLLMVLPLLPTAPGDSSPYATRSAFGLNPLFIDLHQVPEFQATGGEGALSDEQKRQLAEARAAHRVRYDLVFPLKDAAFERSFGHFEQHEWAKQTERARQFQAWRESQGEWLESYALFTAISEAQQRRAWWEWPEPLAHAQPRGAAGRERQARAPGALPRVAAVGGRAAVEPRARAGEGARHSAVR